MAYEDKIDRKIREVNTKLRSYSIPITPIHYGEAQGSNIVRRDYLAQQLSTLSSASAKVITPIHKKG